MQKIYLKQSLALLGSRRFGVFWVACLLANIGTWAQQVAQPWLMLSLDASPFMLGLDAFALGAPGFLLTLVGGALADKADRRHVITLFQSIQMLCPIILVVLVLSHTATPWIVVLLSLVVGTTDALSMPSFHSIVPSIVEREQIAQAIALNATQFNLSRILGPAITGLLMASVGMAAAFAVSAVSYLPFILVALWVLPRAAIQAEQPSQGRKVTARELTGNVGEVLRNPSLRGALLTSFATALLCAPLITFCPLLIKEVFHGDVEQFSTSLGAFGLGGLLGAVLLMAINPQSDQRRISTAAALAYDGVVLLAASTPWQWSLPLLLVLAGIAMTASNASANALVQSQAPAAIRGQSLSLYMLSARGGTALGGLLTGAVVSLVGVREALLINGAIAIAAQLWIGRSWMQAGEAAAPAV